MEMNFHYDNPTNAISALKMQGYNVDFNLEENRMIGPGSKYKVEDFKILQIYRYEGDSDPADEVIIYAIGSASGIKGVIISGYGIQPEENTYEIISRLSKEAYSSL